MDSGLEFEWGPAKADANFRKHGITFDQVIGVFYDPMVVTQCATSPAVQGGEG